MAKRNRINVTLDDTEMANINEYCRVHRMTPQAFFKAGGKRLIEEDILERRADILTIKSMREVKAGLSEPIDDLLKMIEEDRQIGEEMVAAELKATRAAR